MGLPHIDEKLCEQIKSIAPYIDRDTHFFVEYLARYTDKEDVRRVGDILLEMLKAALPMFVEEHMKGIVAKLIGFGFNAKANTIRSTYGDKGCHFLRDLRNDNNPKQKPEGDIHHESGRHTLI